MNKKLEILFGAISDPIAKQLREQNISFSETEIRILQQDADVVTRLFIKGLITDSMARHARKKIMKLIAQEVR